jgi:exodeoxyribonuclease-5
MGLITLSPEQKTAHDAILAFVKEKKPQLRIGGYAGTGKTTLMAQTVRALRKKNKKIVIAFACFTGKAAYVLREKLSAAKVLTGQEYVGTIHGLIYEPILRNGLIEGWRRRPTLEGDLIVVDEASMVNETIWNDLKSYKVPIVAVGDHGQLPPIQAPSATPFSLMFEPDHTLTQIQRQAAGNPIIELSVLARETGVIPFGEFTGNGSGYAKKIRARTRDVLEGVKSIHDTLFLCGRNATRSEANAVIRQRLGFGEAKPLAGETVICLKNNREKAIFNGMTGVIRKIEESDEHFWHAEILMLDGGLYADRIVKTQFGSPITLREHKHIDPRGLRDLFDWGYCLTVHKAQGSEAENVVLFEERFSQMTDANWRRWLYTGVTRARRKLLVVGI